MKILLATVSNRRSKASGPSAEMLQEYISRASRLMTCTHRNFGTEDEFLEYLLGAAGRTKPMALLADRDGQQLSSEEVAEVIRFARDGGTQQWVLAIGPADGWSPGARARADKLLAFGRITLPHELAAVVAAEQVYRALTILSGHPYHCGH
ncbi:MAG: 23S rRNA (pseudouridine(1915)-N(3))-methyltransferase RlmH [Acidobacteriaceae bacterium]